MKKITFYVGVGNGLVFAMCRECFLVVGLILSGSSFYLGGLLGLEMAQSLRCVGKVS